MAYTANIPQPNDKISNSQPQILQNFQALNTYTSVDHVSLNAANQGKHKTATFPTAAAPAAAGATEVGLYSANGPTSGVPELFINKTAKQVPFTESLNAATGWTWLPSGIQIMWGTGVAHTPVVFPAGGFSTAAFSVTVTINDNAANMHFIEVVSGTLNAAGFDTRAYTRNGNAGTPAFYYIAIGY